MKIMSRKFRTRVLGFILAGIFIGINLATGVVWAEAESSLSAKPDGKEASFEKAALGAVSPEDSGSLMDIDYRDVDIKEIARAFSEISGMNIIVSDEAQAKVTLKMSEVNWKTALEVILDTYNLAYLEKDNFIIITTLERRRMQEESGALETKVLRLNFVKVSDLKGVLDSLLSSRGKINIDERTNSLLIIDLKEKIKEVEDIAMQLDMRTPQVLIEIMILDVKLTDAFKWGVVETLTNHIRTEYEADDPETAKWTKLPKWKGASSVLGVADTASFQWAKTIFTDADLNFTLDAIIKNTDSKILANPRVVTLDNLEATIDIVTQQPYTELTQSSSTGNTTTTSFKDIGINLKVKPHISKDNYISMEVTTEHSADTGSTSAGVPIVDKRKAATNVLVKDGETIVLGGLRRRDHSNTAFKIPLLGDIPLLGNLFRSKNQSVTETELVIFITPHLVGDVPLGDRERMQLEEMKNIRELTAETISFSDKELLPLRTLIKIK